MMQNRLVRIVLILVVLGTIATVVGFGVFLALTDTSRVSTTPVEAPTLEVDAETSDTQTLFHIVPAESQVRFIIHEELMGTPTEVIGETDQIAGDILIDFETPANSELGTVRIDLARIATPNEMRNRALRTFILESTTPELQYAEFTATTLNGLPESVTIGTAFNFQIVGNLTVHGVTNEVTFEATVTPVSDTRIEGSATTEVLYADYNMTIPEARGVANVTDEVQLEIDFVATVASDATPEATEGN
jgi:polyisoprenoid-binding protein YceI